MAQMIVELIKLASLIITLNKSAACAGRVADILKVKSTMDYPSFSTYSAQISKDLATATADASLSENAIVFNDVTFEYNKARCPQSFSYQFFCKKGTDRRYYRWYRKRKNHSGKSDLQIL